MSLLIKKEMNEEKKRVLNQTLGAFDLTLLGIGAIIGTGIFVLTGIVAAKHAGPAIVLSFVLAAIVCACVAFCYAEFASTVPVSGSVYSYTYITLGEIFAFIVGWCVMLEYLLATSAVAAGWSAYFQSLLLGFHIKIPTLFASAPGMAKGGIIDLPAVFIVLVVTFLLSRGAKESARINNIMVIIKLAVILGFIIVGGQYVKPENWQPFLPFGFHGVIGGAATVFFAFLGFDAVATAAEEVKRPQRNVPIGLLVSLCICTILYIGVSFILTGMVPFTELNVADPVAYALRVVGEDKIAGLLSVGAIAGLTTVLLVAMFAFVRVSYSMSRDGLLPKKLSSVHKRFQTPFLNTWITGMLAALLAGLVDLNLLANLVNVGTITAFIFVCIAVIALRKTNPNIERPFRAPLVPFLPIMSIISCMYLALNLSKVTLISFMVWVMIGILVYFVYAKKHSNVRKRNGA
ncbi:APC family permease [Bacillus pseudomycoides]|uniref:APC family permease n=1 Tax=Bacillus pseudomycoides TaxID=64104 RepID=UPI000BEB68F8|nr:amino acid permease [Bacillus pseudomycoides]PEB43726.1 amino acid permease [Bacillus pseudomycoides]PGD83942.1 amino acid permease [Bacillus pseudomycoides]PGD97592.1 amino acid permease [Bacillus pseudomycoides]PHB20082.1 amino acid permease [Bacillus pseudomycoides]PHE67871.1 amino acid permease [Bacillus pseudomycoides]